MKTLIFLFLVLSFPALAVESTYEFRTENYHFICTKFENKTSETHGCSEVTNGYTYTIFFDKHKKTCEWKDAYKNINIQKCDKINARATH